VTSEALGSYPCGRLGPCLHLRICLCVRATGWYTTPVWCLEAACESCHAVVRSIGDSIVPGYSMTLGSALILCVGLLCWFVLGPLPTACRWLPSCCVLTGPFLIPSVSLCTLASYLIRRGGARAHLTTHVNFKASLKNLSKCSHFLRSHVLLFMNSERHSSSLQPKCGQ
jgi:hypothetical protein